MKKKIKIAIDSPAAAGAGSQAALLAKYYNLFYLDTGKIYRFVGNLKILYNNNFSYNLVKKIHNFLQTLPQQKKLQQSILEIT